MDEKNQELTVDQVCEQFINGLKEARQSQGITAQKLADLTGMKQSNITRLETINSKPNLQTIVRYCKPLGIDLMKVFD